LDDRRRLLEFPVTVGIQDNWKGTGSVGDVQVSGDEKARNRLVPEFFHPIPISNDLTRDPGVEVRPRWERFQAKRLP
jgi:hypothetical protein